MVLSIHFVGRKSKLPIEMENSKEKDFKHQLDYWDPDEIVQHASKMSTLKKAIYSKARETLVLLRRKTKNTTTSIPVPRYDYIRYITKLK